MARHYSHHIKMLSTLTEVHEAEMIHCYSAFGLLGSFDTSPSEK